MKSYLALLLSILLVMTGCGRDSPPQQAEASESRLDPVERQVTILATGDLMVHGDQLEGAFSGDGYDFAGSFEAVSPYLRQGDLCVGNLETILAGEEAGYSDYPRFNTPDSFAWALADAGFDLVSTANNHCLDQGRDGLVRTLETLENAGISHVGTAASGDANPVFLWEKNGIRVAFVAFTYGTNDNPVPPGEGYLVSMLTEENVISALREAKNQEPDWIIALPHMGREYATAVDEQARQWGEMMLYYGADMVLASHPHVLQPIETVRVLDAYGREKEGIVAYSLGNFLSSQWEEPRDVGIILEITLSKEEDTVYLKELAFRPTWVQIRGVGNGRMTRVLSLYDAYGSYENGRNPFLLTERQQNRIERAHSEVTALYLGRAVSSLDMRESYRIPLGK